jgi:hypothetical protein
MALVSGDIKRYIAGQITANGTTEVTINVPNLEANSVVIPVLNTAGGTPNNIYIFSKDVSAKTVGFKSAASNTSVYDIVVFS